MGEGQYLEIILLAMVAAFVFFRLRSVLGRRTGHEQRPGSRFGFGGNKESDGDNVVALPDRGADERTEAQRKQDAKIWADDSPVAAGLTQVKIADPSFEPETFTTGARAAYEMVVTAFAEGDRETLRNLLNDEVFENFSGAIEEREKEGQTLESSIVSIKGTDIVEAGLNGTVAEVTVKFATEMITALRDKDGELLPGQMTSTRLVTDIWTFARDTKSRDPNWLLIETRSEN
jgi:predicted lipid-binding transport protein (Tim44 family)